MRQKEISPVDIETLRLYLVDGLTMRVIAAKGGVSPERVRQRIAKFGVTGRYVKVAADPAFVRQYVPEWVDPLGVSSVPVPASAEPGVSVDDVMALRGTRPDWPD